MKKTGSFLEIWDHDHRGKLFEKFFSFSEPHGNVEGLVLCPHGRRMGSQISSCGDEIDLFPCFMSLTFGYSLAKRCLQGLYRVKIPVLP